MAPAPAPSRAIAAAIWPAIVSDARLSGSASKCAYRAVVAASEWPSSFPMIGRPRPATGAKAGVGVPRIVNAEPFECGRAANQIPRSLEIGAGLVQLLACDDDPITVRVHETMPKALARHRRETGRKGFVFYRFERAPDGKAASCAALVWAGSSGERTGVMFAAATSARSIMHSCRHSWLLRIAKMPAARLPRDEPFRCSFRRRSSSPGMASKFIEIALIKDRIPEAASVHLH
jgi:hypothetical protein